MTPVQADGVISVWPNPVINPWLYIWCNVRKRVIFRLITVLGQVLRRETRAQSARCAVLHAVHMYSAQYRGLHAPWVSQSLIGDHRDNFSPTSTKKCQIKNWEIYFWTQGCPENHMRHHIIKETPNREIVNCSVNTELSKVLIFKLGSFYFTISI